jgi:hypothetical protein
MPDLEDCLAARFILNVFFGCLSALHVADGHDDAVCAQGDEMLGYFVSNASIGATDDEGSAFALRSS